MCRIWPALVVLLTAVLAPLALAQPPTSRPAVAIDLVSAEPGKLPPHFATVITGAGDPAAWSVVATPDDKAHPKVLAQTSADDVDYRFPVCIYETLLARDVCASVDFRTISGKTDQAAGLVVRYRDKDNYYVVRANALEDNVRLYRVVNGKREQFAGTKCKVEPATWHTLTLTVSGQHFSVSMNGKPLFEADDDTFKDPGLVGIWTKADSVTHFDQLRVTLSDDAK